MNDSGRVSAATIVRSAKPTARNPHTRHGVGNETVLSKMIRDTSGNERQSSDAPYLGNFGYLGEVSDNVANNIEDAKNLTQLLPEIEICIQVLLALILSPKDITNTELKHGVQPNILPPEMTGEMLEVIKNYFEHNYKIKPLLPDKLRKALFVDGADVTIVIPENSLDDLINGRTNKKITLESFRQKDVYRDIAAPMGFMADKAAKPTPAKAMSLEDLMANISQKPEALKELQSLSVDGYKTDKGAWNFSKIPGFVVPSLFDNPQMLKLESLTDSVKAVQNRTALEGLGGHSYGDVQSMGLESLGEQMQSMYHNPELKPEDIVMMARQEEASRDAIGPPLVKGSATEACVPVCRPGRPKNPIGFLFLTDEYGAFVSSAQRSDYMRNISAGVFNNRNAITGMLNNATDQMNMEDSFNASQLTAQACQAFRDLAIRDIENRFMAGSVGNVTVSRTELAYDLMLERAFAGKQTRIVYVPADMVIYWAYNFNDNGTGRSLLEDNKILSSIRALTLFMNVETHLRNSIDHRTLNITVDEDDPNKTRTKEMILHEYARQRSNAVPWATSNPRRMVEVAQNSGLAINVEGGDAYPGTKVSVDSRDIQYREVNLDMDEDLRKRQTMGFGLAPEIVDMSTQIEFSSKMATSNELSLKRAIVIQDATNAFIRETIIKITLSHRGLMDKLRAIVGKHTQKMNQKKVAEMGENYFIQAFFAIYSCTLPRPDTGLANRMTDLGEYSDALTKVLDEVMPDDLLQGAVTGESANEWVGIVKASVKSTLVLQYCRNNNIMPELTNMFKNDTVEDPGTILIEEGIANANRLSKIIQAVGLQLYAKAIITENQFTTLKERMDTERVEGTEAVAGEGTSGGGGDYGGDDFGGDDDFDLGDDDGDGDGGEFDFGDDSGSEEEEPSEDSGNDSGGESGDSSDSI